MKRSPIFYGFARTALAIAAAWALMGWPIARAQSIPLINPSFEIPKITANNVGFNIPGWPALPNSNTVSGVANLPPTAFSPSTDGTQVGFIRGYGAIEQDTGAKLTPFTRYVLTLDFLGSVAPNSFPKSPGMALMTGLYLAFDFGVDVSTGNPHTLTFDALPGGHTQEGFPIDSEFGKPITIFIRNSSGLVGIDNVRLETIPLGPFVSQGFASFSLAQHEIVRPGVICSVTSLVPCITTLEVIDPHGVLLSQAHLNLRPGEPGFLELPSEAQGREPMEVVPRWFLTQGSASFSIDVFDSEDLRTRFFVNGGDGSVAKTGDLDSGPVSMTRSDSGRLKVYCDGSVRVEGTLRMLPCRASLAFHDGSGRVLKQSGINLAPATAGFLDLSFEETHSANRRAVIIPSLTVTGGPAVGSFALLDSATGRTITQSYPAAAQSVAR
ncbi:MAG TPA: hypothetical protein VGZ73_15230 [Bryobacteraceae bacterium]|jgi:hypothetical protein|nr:hypothetical protein [Bryobacteraceae bacterium]